MVNLSYIAEYWNDQYSPDEDEEQAERDEQLRMEALEDKFQSEREGE